MINQAHPAIAAVARNHLACPTTLFTHCTVIHSQENVYIYIYARARVCCCPGPARRGSEGPGTSLTYTDGRCTHAPSHSRFPAALATADGDDDDGGGGRGMSAARFQSCAQRVRFARNRNVHGLKPHTRSRRRVYVCSLVGLAYVCSLW